MKFALPVLLGSVIGLSTFPALADEADSSPVSFNVGLTSDYSYRGLTQTYNKAALDGGVVFSSRYGFSLGAWG
ncbi:MAG: TorF family putative porin, partial [Burkholderiaceae bacterium]